MRRLLILFLPFALCAADRWTLFRAGPFEVYTSAGNESGRTALNELEQLRNALGQVLGKKEVASVWPIRILIFRSRQDVKRYEASGFHLRRDAWIRAVEAKQPLPLRDVTKILVEAATARMPEAVEQGLYSVFSTLQVEGTRVALGALPPERERDQNWATMHMLTVTPEYGGRARVMFSNVEQGADWVAAYKNAFSRIPREIEEEAKQYLAAGSFGVRKLSGLPINPERDFRARAVEPATAAVLQADLLDGDAARTEYRSVLNQFENSPEALEGLGMCAEAIAAGSVSARCQIEVARGLSDKTAAWPAMLKAAELNPRWGEPEFRLGELATDPAQKLRHLKRATELEPRVTAYWQALAEAYLSAKDFTNAGKAWIAAEHSARSQEEKDRLRVARRQVEELRSEHLAQERRKEQEALDQLKQEMMAKIRAAEDAARRDDPAAPGVGKVVDWWDDNRPREKTEGLLQRVDCIKGLARLVVQGKDGKPVQYLVRDPSQVVLLGGGEMTLGCGPQKPPRAVTVEYLKEPNPKLNTAGEALVIEFR